MMSDGIDRDVLQISQDIEKYLKNHRDAADTLEGIIRWWLLRQRIEDSSVKVKCAVDYLCQKGLIEEVPIQGSASLYVAQRPVQGELCAVLVNEEGN